MCGRYALHHALSEIAEALEVQQAETATLQPRYNIAPGTRVLSIERSTGTAAFQHWFWGYRPAWADSKAPQPINARAEGIAESRYFRAAFARHRCLVPASGWFEWQQDEDRQRQPHYLTHRDGALLCFAAIFAPTEDRQDASLAILTHAAAAPIAHIHPRMPLALTPESWQRWLDPELEDRDQLRQAIHPIPADALQAWPVSTAVNKPEHDRPEILEPVR